MDAPKQAIASTNAECEAASKVGGAANPEPSTHPENARPSHPRIQTSRCLSRKVRKTSTLATSMIRAAETEGVSREARSPAAYQVHKRGKFIAVRSVARSLFNTTRKPASGRFSASRWLLSEPAR